MDFIFDLLESNVNYNSIIVVIGIYFLLIWLMVAFWVFNDAKKRYKGSTLPIIFGLLVLILNIPALFFYIIIRPEKDEDNILYLHSEESGMSGVNVPIVNFTGDNGFVISLQLKVGNTSNTSSTGESNMNINVDWDTKDPKMATGERKDVITVENPKTEDEMKVTIKTEQVKETTKKALSKFKKISGKFASNVQNYAKNVESDTEEEVKK